MNRKNLFWILLFLGIALASGAYALLAGTPGQTASVYVDGELYGQYDLRAAVLPYEVRVETEYGVNVLRIRHGAVQVAEADCPGQDCVRQGEIEDSLIPIVCLPHHLVVEIED